MTSDAKIGLLLGLVFIFIIAFIINGLPSIRGAANSNELTTNMVSSQNQSPGIGANERQVITRIRPVRREVVMIESVKAEVVRSSGAVAVNRTRFTRQLPRRRVGGNTGRSEISAKAASVVNVASKSAAKKNAAGYARYYRVKEGDNLSLIAQKFYGAEEGNRQVNIDRIFAANRKVLRSSDEIRIGQKLLVPPLGSAAVKESRLERVFSRVKSGLSKPKTQRAVRSTAKQVKQGRVHIVRDGRSFCSTRKTG